MKISSIMRLNLLIMPIVLIFFQPLSLAGRKGYGKMMQVRMAWCRSRCSDAGPRMVWCRSTDGVMQVHGWCDAGPRMVRCRSTDGAMQVPGCANFRDGNTVVESRSTFGKNQCYRLNMWAIIQPLKSFHFWVDPLFKKLLDYIPKKIIYGNRAETGGPYTKYMNNKEGHDNFKNW